MSYLDGVNIVVIFAFLTAEDLFVILLKRSYTLYNPIENKKEDYLKGTKLLGTKLQNVEYIFSVSYFWRNPVFTCAFFIISPQLEFSDTFLFFLILIPHCSKTVSSAMKSKFLLSRLSFHKHDWAGSRSKLSAEILAFGKANLRNLL